MDYGVEIRLLSSRFLADYPAELFPELMTKQGRPYTCLLIDMQDAYRVCIPFRSSISHNSAYLFKSTQRSKRSRSGLDYTKLVLIQEPAYVDDAQPVVDQDEYMEVMRNIERIVREVYQYIDDYCRHINGTRALAERAYDRRYKYATLPYFHDILGLPALKSTL